MNSDRQQYEEMKNDVVKYSKEYLSAQQIEKFTSHVDDKLNNFKPTVMVYGTYNSGKSTLINALFGKDEMAKTGDAPETSTISEYEYNGYTIYDTPGINAPQEHQDVTDEHLSKCELILFVLSNDGSFEEIFIYEKISEIVKLNKPILIVINNKSGIDRNSIEEKEQMDKINLNLTKIGDKNNIENIESKVNISMVNAKTALKAKLENKNLLLENSNIKQLENDIDTLLASAGKSEVTNTLNIFIGEFIGNTLVQIDTKIDNPEMKKTQELITYIEKLKQKSEVELKEIINDGVAIATRNIFELFLAKNQANIEDFVYKTTQNMQNTINAKIKTIYSELDSKIETFNREFKELSLSIDSIDTTVDNQTISTQTESDDKASKAINCYIDISIKYGCCLSQ